VSRNEVHDLRACKNGLVTAQLTWVLQANLRDRPFLVRLQATLDELGEDWHAVEVAPFVPELPTLPFAAEARAIVCYGPSFVPRVAAAPAWRPGIFFDAATSRWSAMAAAWGDLMFSPDGAVATVFDALEALAREPMFVRPDEDSKSFDGGVFADAATLRAQLGSTPLDTPAIVARARPVDAEWRCFVVNGSAIDSSEYRRAGRPSLHRGAPPRVLELAERAAARWVPSNVTCIDIASSGDHFGIIEANCFNGARFYACDPATVIAGVTRHVRSSFERSQGF